RTLRAGGAELARGAPNPLATQDDVAAALAGDGSITVLAVHGEGPDAYAEHVAALAGSGPDITLDDGADLVGLMHGAFPDAARALRGATEETTTGLLRLRTMEGAGRLLCPVVAVNESRTERAFNDRYGTGQSTLDGILRATNLFLAGRTLVVLGYGWTGRGVAQRARGAGASVIVCEVDPLRALEARMEGYEVMPALDAAERGEVFVTVTGSRDVLSREHFERMPDGAVLANAGHFDVEISRRDLLALAAGRVREVRPLVEQYEIQGRRLNLLARGRVVNLAAAEGHPASVMDLSFAVHALVVEDVVERDEPLAAGVHAVPAEIDRAVASLKLTSLGVGIDRLSPDQQEYLRSWAPGSNGG
ncbi:MAG: adenosylhomocysteinase, partial [Solirubrobacteraceae bacterium]|nr:adenosylhomocysteinase [Solirubrobacteraceae bacterium]